MAAHTVERFGVVDQTRLGNAPVLQLLLSTAGILARLSPGPTLTPGHRVGRAGGWEGTVGDTPQPQHHCGTGKSWGCLAKAATAPGLAGGTWWVTPLVSLRFFLHLLKCLYVNPGLFLVLLSLLSPPARAYSYYETSLLRCQSHWTFSTDISAFSFLPPSEMIITVYRIRVIGAEGSNCC